MDAPSARRARAAAQGPVEGLSQRRAARELGVSRNTVHRYLTWAEPVRVEREPRRKPVLERVQPRLDELIEE